MTIMHVSGSIESVRPLTNDERRASWAAKYFLLGWHRKPQKPRIRLQVTVPDPLREPSRAASAPVDANPSLRVAGVDDSHNPLPASPDACSRVQVGTGRQSIHRSPCACGDDAQRHYALIARDLMTTGRADELTDEMRQAYDYEFGGVPEPEPPQIPEF